MNDDRITWEMMKAGGDAIGEEITCTFDVWTTAAFAGERKAMSGMLAWVRAHLVEPAVKSERQKKELWSKTAEAFEAFLDYKVAELLDELRAENRRLQVENDDMMAIIRTRNAIQEAK